MCEIVGILAERQARTVQGRPPHTKPLTPGVLKTMDLRVSFGGTPVRRRTGVPPARAAKGQPVANQARLEASSSLRNGLVSRGRSAATPSLSA